MTFFLKNIYVPSEDLCMTVDHYERNFDQNEILGLNDLKTENFEKE